MFKLSIIMPAYNSERFIYKALESIPKRNDIEIIVVNDGSTDKTKEIVSGFNIKLIDRKENLGIGYSRKEALKVADTSYRSILSFPDVTISTDGFIY